MVRLTKQWHVIWNLQLKFKGFWRWWIIICKIVFLSLSIVHISIKLLRFGRSDLDPGPDLRLAQPGGPTAKVSVLPFLPEDGRRSSFRNVVTLLKYRPWTKLKKQFYGLKSKVFILNIFQCNVYLWKYKRHELHIICLISYALYAVNE
jgi:hypothetical protein